MSDEQSFSEETWADSLGDYSEGILKDINPAGDTTEAFLDDVGLSMRGPGEDIGENLDALGTAETWGDYAEAGAELLADVTQYSVGLGIGNNIVEQFTGEDDYIEASAGDAGRYAGETAEAAYDYAAESASAAYDTAATAADDAYNYTAETANAALNSASEAWDAVDLNPFDDE